MIADGDSVARNAFRLALLSAAESGETLPVATTQELDPNDILEVEDMAAAIARAEELVTTPRPASVSVRDVALDLFESLGRPTDDAAGPATPAPVGVLPLPLPASSKASMVIAAPLVAQGPEDDAYFHPSGRIRALADQTLESYRPEPTLLVRARARRTRFAWIVGAALVPLVALAAFAVLGREEKSADDAVATTTIATATIVVPTASAAKRNSGQDVPVVDVNSLPAARAKTIHD